MLITTNDNALGDVGSQMVPELVKSGVAESNSSEALRDALVLSIRTGIME
jgi:hypothetical protein